MNRAALMKGSEMAFNAPPNPRIVINVNTSLLCATLLHAQRAHVTEGMGGIRTGVLGALVVSFIPSGIFPVDQRSVQIENLY